VAWQRSVVICPSRDQKNLAMHHRLVQDSRSKRLSNSNAGNRVMRRFSDARNRLPA
jgi:hypothetical protein